MNSFFRFHRRILKMQGVRRGALDHARARVMIISATFALFYIFIAVRAFDLSIIQYRVNDGVEPYVAAAAGGTYRADIVDRNGVLLARTLETASLYADPKMIPDPESVARDIVGVFGDLSFDDVLALLRRQNRFVWVRRNLTPQEQYDILRLGHPGLSFIAERSRVYPQGHLAAHLVGYTDVDGRGLAGIERSFDEFLAKGGQKPLALSLDIRLQHILHRELSAAIQKFSAQGGAGAIIDIATGDVLAGVSLPDFDPHVPGQSNAENRFNKLTLGVYELGSTFKVFSTAAALEKLDLSMAHRFDAREPLQRGRFRVSDFHPQKRVLSLPESFMHSSNIASALIGEMVGTQALKDFYSDLGLFTPMALEIREIGRPLLPPRWREINTLTAAYGHGIAVTPLQMMVAAAGIANGGIRVEPTLLYDRPVREGGSVPDVRIVSERTAHRMRQLMRLAVTDGTGRQADIPGYRVGGKTGTAEKIGERGYDRRRLISSFVGFFPMEAPRYGVFVMVDEPRGTRETFGYATGGWVAAPTAGRIINAMAPLVGVEPDFALSQDGRDPSASLKRYISHGE